MRLSAQLLPSLSWSLLSPVVIILVTTAAVQSNPILSYPVMSEKQSLNSLRSPPPPLPPRLPPRHQPAAHPTSPSFPLDDAPPAYESIITDPTQTSYTPLTKNDPRSSSTQSLVPSKSTDRAGRRKLLLIYIHGFMGDETSFQSFPAHVHSLVAALVAETHVVHTKIYPRYLSKKNIMFARDDFSRW